MGGERILTTRLGEPHVEEDGTVRLIPEEANEIALSFADHLVVAEIQSPLATFLTEVSGIDGVGAVFLSAWQHPERLRGLMLCAITSTHMRERGKREKANQAVRKVYHDLDIQSREDGRRFSLNIVFMNTPSTSLHFLSGLQTNLSANDPIFRERMSQERLSMFTVARTNPKL